MSVLFTIAVAYAITVTGPLLLFNPFFVSFEQARHEVPARLGLEQAVIDRITGEILGDLFVGGDFDAAPPGEGAILDDFERSHMQDVGGLVRTLLILDLIAIGTAIAGAWWMRREVRRSGRLLITAAGVVGAAALVVALLFAVAFDQAFLAFHQLFFREGTYLFGPESNLIRLFPQGFWFEASLAAGATVVISAVAVVLLGARRLRAA